MRLVAIIRAAGGKDMAENTKNERLELGGRLKDSREYLGLSQDEVARAIGVPRSALSLMESGQRRVDVFTLKKLGDLYGRPNSYFTGENIREFSVLPEFERLIRVASKLPRRDLDELTRFAEFLENQTNKDPQHPRRREAAVDRSPRTT